MRSATHWMRRWVAAGCVLAMLVCAGAADEPTASAPETPAKKTAPKVDPGHDAIALAATWPHPLITEVFFAVPTAGEFDANKDGVREVSGDEFIEIVNPHDRTIELRGYTLTDGAPSAKAQFKFTFPAVLVPARGVVVVFNGHASKIPGPVGDAKRAPAGVNDQFGKAAVFSVNLASSRVGFANAGDAVCLRAPDGKALQRVRWGKADEKAGGAGFVVDEVAPTTSKGSVQRDGIGKDASWKTHAEVDGSAFSPGVFGAVTPAKAAEKPSMPAAPGATEPASPKS